MSPWDSLAPAALLSCEAGVEGWVAQPSNTYSNIVYFLVAVLLRRRAGRRDKRNHDVPMALLSLGIGIASTLAHASLASIFAIMDFTAIFVLFSYIMTANLAELRGWTTRRRHTVALALAGLSVVPQLFGQRTGLLIFTVYLVGCLGTEALALRKLRMRPTDRRYLATSLGLLSAGLVCFFLDERRVICTPDDHIFQLHSVWHLFAGASLYFVALYFESKHRPITKSG